MLRILLIIFIFSLPCLSCSTVSEVSKKVSSKDQSAQQQILADPQTALKAVLVQLDQMGYSGTRGFRVMPTETGARVLATDVQVDINMLPDTANSEVRVQFKSDRFAAKAKSFLGELKKQLHNQGTTEMYFVSTPKLVWQATLATVKRMGRTPRIERDIAAEGSVGMFHLPRAIVTVGPRSDRPTGTHLHVDFEKDVDLAMVREVLDGIAGELRRLQQSQAGRTAAG